MLQYRQIVNKHLTAFTLSIPIISVILASIIFNKLAIGFTMTMLFLIVYGLLQTNNTGALVELSSEYAIKSSYIE